MKPGLALGLQLVVVFNAPALLDQLWKLYGRLQFAKLKGRKFIRIGYYNHVITFKGMSCPVKVAGTSYMSLVSRFGEELDTKLC